MAKQELEQFIKEHNIQLLGVYQGTTPSISFPDSVPWLCVIAGSVIEAVKFYMGKGHTKYIATAPTLCDILYSMSNDAEALGLTFEGWCGDFGYEHTLEAKKVYQACRKSGHKLVRIIGADNLDALREACQDY